MRYEGAEGGEQYLHVYGPVPACSVTRVITAGRDGSGRLILAGSPAAPGRSPRQDTSE